jgi:hypothetical protein
MNTTIQAKKRMVFALSVAVVLLVGLGGALTLSRAKHVAPDGAVQILTNEKHGYSLRYPTGYDVQYPNEHETAIFVGSLLNVEQPRVTIEVRDAAGRAVEQVADELVAEIPVGFEIPRTSIVIDGEQAIVLDNLPGQDINRQVVVVHEDRLYRMMFVPVGEDYGEVFAQTEDLYATVINSFRFLSGPVALDERPVAGQDGTVISQGGLPEIQLENEGLVGNPFETLLGPIQTPDGSSVRPCSGETPLLCIYQGRTLLGSVELVTFPLARHLDFQKMLSDAGIPLGSVDYTDPLNAPQARTALAAYAAAYLDDLAQDRSVTYPKGRTFTLVAPEWIHVGSLPGVAYGFAGVDQDGHVFERRLTYAAFDNDTLYLFGVFYASGMPESFPSDKDLLRFEPYLRQILAGLRLPASDDWHSPGAELLSEPRLVVQRPDDSIQYVTLEGTSAVLVADAPASLLPAGYGGVHFGGAPMTDGPAVYVRQWSGGLYVLDTILGHLFPLDFVPSVASPVAVRPLTEGLLPEGAPISLAWGEFSASYTATAHLYLSAPDGSHKVEALEETYGASDPWTQFVPWRWRQDGQLYLIKQPVDGRGGFPPFVGAANLWAFDPQSGSSVELVSDDVTGRKLCLDAISPGDRLVAHHCDEGQITLLDLETGVATAVSLPDQVDSGAHLGSVRFSPDGSRIAFAAMTGGIGLIEETQGYVVVSDSLSLGDVSHVVVTSEAGKWFSVAAWLPGDRLVLQSHCAAPDGWPAVWTVRTDGSGLVKLADGIFLAIG